MAESDEAQQATISKAETVEQMGGFWDTHSLADHWDQTREAEFEVHATRRRRVTLDPDIYDEVAGRARARGILPETLVILWLAERLRGAQP